MKVLYELEDVVTHFSFLNVDVLKFKGTMKESLGIPVIGNEAKLCLALAKAFANIGNVVSLCNTQHTLVEAANASPYGWAATKHLEKEKGVFSIEDVENTKLLKRGRRVC